MQPEFSPLCRQEPATDPYADPDELSSHPKHRIFLYYPPHLRPGIPRNVFPAGFLT